MKYLLFLMLLLAVSCSAGKYTTQKPYICYEVSQASNKQVVHRFANLSLTEGRQFYLDSVCCQPMDTIVIKDYRRGLLRRKHTVFINYKN
jgi:hypothetical protein